MKSKKKSKKKSVSIPKNPCDFCTKKAPWLDRVYCGGGSYDLCYPCFRKHLADELVDRIKLYLINQGDHEADVLLNELEREDFAFIYGELQKK